MSISCVKCSPHKRTTIKQEPGSKSMPSPALRGEEVAGGWYKERVCWEVVGRAGNGGAALVGLVLPFLGFVSQNGDNE